MNEIDFRTHCAVKAKMEPRGPELLNCRVCILLWMTLVRAMLLAPQAGPVAMVTDMEPQVMPPRGLPQGRNKWRVSGSRNHCNQRHRPHSGAPGWLSQFSVGLLISVQVMISWFMGLSPTSGSHNQHRAYLGFCLSPPLSLPLPCSCSHFLSQK